MDNQDPMATDTDELQGPESVGGAAGRQANMLAAPAPSKPGKERDIVASLKLGKRLVGMAASVALAMAAWRLANGLPGLLP